MVCEKRVRGGRTLHMQVHWCAAALRTCCAYTASLLATTREDIGPCTTEDDLQLCFRKGTHHGLVLGNPSLLLLASRRGFHQCELDNRDDHPR